MAPESITDEARRRSDEAVRRIREASRRRIEQQKGWRAFASLCALATLAGGISLTALSARDARVHQQELQAEEAARAARPQLKFRYHPRHVPPPDPDCGGCFDDPLPSQGRRP